MWETAERIGIITANLMWWVFFLPHISHTHFNRAGPWSTSSGVKPTYLVPWVVSVVLNSLKGRSET